MNSCCCTNPVHLGCFAVCGETCINLGIKADTSGEYTVDLHFLGSSKKVFKIEFTQGEEIEICWDCWNEDFCYEMVVYNPDGEKIGCYIFKTEYEIL